MTETCKRELGTYLNRKLAGNFLLNEPLYAHTRYQIGGPADFFVYPRDTEDMRCLLRQCRALNIATYFIGEGANILVSDEGYRGVMISLMKYFTTISKEETIIQASAGVVLKNLVEFCEQQSLGGLQYLAGIPGTIGGALTMNAGTNKGEIGDTVLEISVLDEDLELIVIPAEEVSFNYRSVPQLQGKAILDCRLRLEPAEKSELRQIRITQLADRSAKQPLEYPSCGSVFKRPTDYYVGKMVQDLGLKGFRYGDAMISDKHAGFIVNLGNAKARDVMYLIEKIQDEVYNHFQVKLEPEVKFVGF